MEDKPVEELALQLANTASEIATIEGEIIKATVKLQTKLASLKETDTTVREAIKNAMEQNNVKSFENDEVKITYVAPQEREGIDMNKLKLFHPDLVEKYKKITPVKASVRIKVKDQE